MAIVPVYPTLARYTPYIWPVYQYLPWYPWYPWNPAVFWPTYQYERYIASQPTVYSQPTSNPGNYWIWPENR